jgi:hypothetical protein
MEATNPPVLVNTPAADGSARTFFEIKAGGSLTLKNVLFSGNNNNGAVTGNFVANTNGSKMIVDNCAFVDWQDFALRNQFEGDSISITNSVFINGLRMRNSVWGGFPLRMDVACDKVVLENNSVVNSGRLLANSGPFQNATIHEMHNTYLNQAVAGHENRAYQFITANNIFYNYHFIGRKDENAVIPNNTYDSYFTTWNYFADSKNSLDSISLYLGQNLFYREQEIIDWFDNEAGDTLSVSLLWEHADVDSFIVEDDNYVIGTNYAEIDPGFTTHPGNTDSIVKYINESWTNPTGDWVDWRITSPVTFDGGNPVLSWPPAFDLSYTHTGLQEAGTDGLPLGDLNWFPTKKTEYLANRSTIIAAIVDSMSNATAVYDPATMDNTPLITEIAGVISIKEIFATKGQLDISVYPNPVQENAAIKFNLPQQSNVTISVYNVCGQIVFESAENTLVSGAHVFNFDVSTLSSGVYVYKINAIGVNGKSIIDTKKMIKQ